MGSHTDSCQFVPSYSIICLLQVWFINNGHYQWFVPNSYHAWLTWWVSCRLIFIFALPLPQVIIKSFSNIFPVGEWGWSWKGLKIVVGAGSSQLDVRQLITVSLIIVAFCDWCWSVICLFELLLFLLSFTSSWFLTSYRAFFWCFSFSFLLVLFTSLLVLLFSRHSLLHPTSWYTILSGYFCLGLLIDDTVSESH